MDAVAIRLPAVHFPLIESVSQRLGVKIPGVNKLGIRCENIITTGEYYAPSNTTNYPPIPDIFALIKETGGRLGFFPL